jgi:hypothetical protein
MSEDSRCCGTGTCIINSQGECWCGQRWDGEKMCFQESPAQELAPIPKNSADLPAPVRRPD